MQALIERLMRCRWRWRTVDGVGNVWWRLGGPATMTRLGTAWPTRSRGAVFCASFFSVSVARSCFYARVFCSESSNNVASLFRLNKRAFLCIWFGLYWFVFFGPPCLPVFFFSASWVLISDKSRIIGTLGLMAVRLSRRDHSGVLMASIAHDLTSDWGRLSRQPSLEHETSQIDVSENRWHKISGVLAQRLITSHNT